jgi:predicted GNAT family N-acyltransferase
MARYIKRCMAYSYNLSKKDMSDENLCNLFQHIYQTNNKFNDIKYLYLNNFQQSISTPNKSGEIVVNYYDNAENFGLTQYNINTGEISMIIINREYRGKSLGKQIVSNIIEDMKVNKVKEVWVKAPYNHYFWANVLNKSFMFRTPISSQKGSRGYFLTL